MKNIYTRITSTTTFKEEVFNYIEKHTQSLDPYIPSMDVSSRSNYEKDRYELTHTILRDVLFEVAGTTKGLSNPTFRSQAIIYSLYIINLIRSSVIGSSNMSVHLDHELTSGHGGLMAYHSNPLTMIPPPNMWDLSPDQKVTTTASRPGNKYLPPPVIYLTHGATYQEAPFIATGYTINFDGKKGYEEII